MPGSGGGEAQRDNAREEKEKGVFLILFYYFARQSGGGSWRPRKEEISPPTHLSRAESPAPFFDPFSLPSFLSLLHLDLRRKWTFYETEIMALRQSEGLSSSRREAEPDEKIRQKREYFHLPLLHRLFNLQIPERSMTDAS